MVSNEEIIKHLHEYKDNKVLSSRQFVIEHNLRLVVYIAEKYQNYGTELAELISEGNFGLFLAIENFDFAKNTHFCPYAIIWIRKHIFEFLLKNNCVRIPDWIKRIINRWNKVKNELDRIGTSYTDETIAKILNLKKNHMERVKFCMNAVSVTSINTEDKEFAANIASNNKFSDVLEELVDTENYNKVYSTIDKMSPRDKYIIGERLRGVTLEQIGISLNGLSKERIRQIESEAVEHIKVSVR